MLSETKDINTPLLGSSTTHPIASNENKLSPPKSKSKCSLNEMYRKAMFVCTWLIFTGYITGIAGAIADNRAIKLYGNSPTNLGDLGMELVGLIFGNSVSIDAKASAFCVYAQLCIFVTLLILLKIRTMHTAPQAIVIFTEFAVLINVLFTLRYLNLCLTSFPAPSGQKLYETCTYWDNIWIAPFLVLAAQRETCHDFCFSSHTVIVTCTALMIGKYAKYLNEASSWNGLLTNIWGLARVFLIFMSWTIVLITIVCLLLLELHYSIDITVALMLTFAFWNVSEIQRKHRYGLFGWWCCEDKAVDTSNYV